VLPVATFWKRIANADRGSCRSVDTGATEDESLAGPSEVTPGHDGRGTIATIAEHDSRIAYCECGARLAGGSEQELFDAAQRHLAHHHPQFLGAMGLDVVHQMAEDVRGH
jgi:hypothetical protein